jgi:hypothetical protein
VLLLLARETADKSVYMVVADDPIGHLFLAASFLVIPILAGIGIYRITDDNRVAAVAAVIGWWVFLWAIVDVQTGHLVAK